MNMKEWEDKILSSPLAGKVSGEHDEHIEKDEGYQENVRPNGTKYCKCERCVIIRIKRRRALRFPKHKCTVCGELHFSLFGVCEKCR